MKLSIITINFNNLEGLKKTAESVINQTWKEFEWIIIDGGSTDGSKEYIIKLNDDLTRNGWNPIAYWCRSCCLKRHPALCSCCRMPDKSNSLSFRPENQG